MNLGIVKRYLIFLALQCFIISPFHSQNIDSLINLLPKLNGKEKVQSLDDIGYLLATKDVDRAILFGNRAYKGAKELKDSSLIAFCANDLCLSYFYKGSYDSCIYLSELAYAIRLRLGELRNAGASISKAALAYYEKGKYDVSLEKNLLAADLFEKSGSLVDAARLESNIGAIYERNNQFSKAKEMYEKSADFALKAKDYEGYVSAKSNYGIIVQKLGDIKKSVEIFTELLDISKKYCRPEFLSQIYQELGVAERKLGNTQKGLEFYFKSKEIYDRIGTISGSAIINLNIGNCYVDLKEFNKGEEYLNLGLRQSIEIQSLLWQKKAYFGLYDLERMRGEYKKANEYLEMYQQINDSIYNQQTQENLSKLQTQYDLKQKENTILNQNIQLSQSELAISKRTTQVLILIGIIVVILLVTAFIAQRNKSKKRELQVQFQNRMQNERARISRDLHDNMGAELTIVSSQLDIKANTLKNEKDQAEIELISDQVRKASAMMRDTIWTVSMEKISAEQLGLKIKEFAERTFLPKKINLHFVNTDSYSDLSPELTLNVYRIAQEIINNAFKHSVCKNFYIHILPTQTIFMELKDDGVGFIESEVEKGYGLSNLESRAKEINVSLEVQSNKNEGTLYRLHIDKNEFWNRTS